MNLLATLGAILTILSAGMGALLLIKERGSSEHLVAGLALSWLLGVVVVSCSIWMVGFVVKGALLPTFVALICIALPLAGAKVKKSHLFHFKVRKLTPIELVLGAILAAEVVVVFYFSYVHTLGGDGILNWEIKARYAFRNAGVLPISYLHDAGRGFSHPEYPLAIPYTELWVYLWLGEANQFWAKTIFPLFFVAEVILLATVVLRMTGKTWLALTTPALFLFVPQVSMDGGSMIVGYVDFPLSVFYFAAIGFLMCSCRDNDHNSFAIYASCLALLPWIKQEGTILWFIAALCGGLVIFYKKRPALDLLALLPGLVVIIAWRFYLSSVKAVFSSDFLPLTFTAVADHVSRLGSIVSKLGNEFMNTQRWSLLWCLTAVAAVIFVQRVRDVRAVVLILAIVAPIVFYSLAYILSAWPDYIAHIELSISRLLMHVAPLALLLISTVIPRATTDPDISSRIAAAD